jgi:signal peptidase I
MTHSTDSFVGIQFDPYGPKPDEDLNILVTMRQVGEEDFSVLYNHTGVHRGINAEDYLHGAISQVKGNGEVSLKRKFSFVDILTAVVAGILIMISVAGITKALAFRVVLTGSMIPAINPGDLIITVNDKYKNPVLNDVVVYIGERFDGSDVAPFAHRIIGGDASSGWVVKGDANPAADVQKPTADDIDGVVIATVPGIGNYLSPQFLVMLTIIGFGAWFIFDWARD